MHDLLSGLQNNATTFWGSVLLSRRHLRDCQHDVKPTLSSVYRMPLQQTQFSHDQRKYVGWQPPDRVLSIRDRRYCSTMR
jgi:hypothetical protein